MQYFTYLDKCPKEYEQTYQKFLKLAKKLDSTVEIYQVKAGFTIKEHAPKMGNCYNDFKYLQNWDFNDKPTKDCIVFWIPKLVPESLNETAKEQEEMLKKYDCKFESASLQIGLILAHLKRTGKRLPEHYNYIRTSTFHVNGSRLIAGNFNENGLDCDGWGGSASDSVGFFLLGVEPLDSGELGISPMDTSALGHLESRIKELEDFKAKVEKVLKI